MQITNNINIYNGLEMIAEQYDAFIFDVWGVIHNGVSLYPGVLECLQALRKKDKQILMLSNSPSRAKYMVLQLETIGVQKHLFDFVVTSGESTHHALQSYSGKNVYCIGSDNNPNCLDGIDIKNIQSPDDADVALICELGINDTVEGLQNTLEQCLNKNLALICANPDKVVDIGGNYILAVALSLTYMKKWAVKLNGMENRMRLFMIGHLIC